MEKKAVLIALFAALIAALALMPKFMLASGIPITLQSLGVMLAGTVLGAWAGGLAVALYVGLALLGLPILSGGTGGLGVLNGPSVGFILGFPLAAFATGFLMERMNTLPVFGAAVLASVLGGVIVLYIPGILGFAAVLDKGIGESTWIMAPFIPGDLIKAVLVGGITAGLAKARPQSLLSRA